MNELRRLIFATTVALATAPRLGAQIPAPQPASQNPSPMLETARAHERLTAKKLDGVSRSFAGPSGKPVDVFIPGEARAHDSLDLVIHFLGAAWLPEQAVAALQTNTV